MTPNGSGVLRPVQILRPRQKAALSRRDRFHFSCNVGVVGVDNYEQAINRSSLLPSRREAASTPMYSRGGVSRAHFTVLPERGLQGGDAQIISPFPCICERSELSFSASIDWGWRLWFSSSGVTHPAAFASVAVTRCGVSVDNSFGKAVFLYKKEKTI